MGHYDTNILYIAETISYHSKTNTSSSLRIQVSNKLSYGYKHFYDLENIGIQFKLNTFPSLKVTLDLRHFECCDFVFYFLQLPDRCP